MVLGVKNTSLGEDPGIINNVGYQHEITQDGEKQATILLFMISCRILERYTWQSKIWTARQRASGCPGIQFHLGSIGKQHVNRGG